MVFLFESNVKNPPERASLWADFVTMMRKRANAKELLFLNELIDLMLVSFHNKTANSIDYGIDKNKRNQDGEEIRPIG